jgi:hypothetical protein
MIEEDEMNIFTAVKEAHKDKNTILEIEKTSAGYYYNPLHDEVYQDYTPCCKR